MEEHQGWANWRTWQVIAQIQNVPSHVEVCKCFRKSKHILSPDGARTWLSGEFPEPNEVDWKEVADFVNTSNFWLEQLKEE